VGPKRYVGVIDGILNGDDNEKPRGQWNKLDLYCHGQTAVHVVNGTVNLVLTNIRRRVDGRTEAVTGGRIQLQSEGAEVFFRKLRLRPITATPGDVLTAAARPVHNSLTTAERAAGWRLLFDGATTKGWRGYGKKAMPGGWQVRDGALTRAHAAGDIVTAARFGDFELLIDWKISKGGNSGIFYRVEEDPRAPAYHSGPEFEIRDNAYWLDDPFKTGAAYGLYAPQPDASQPVGYWNRTRIVARGNHVEHWLNGVRVVAYDLHSPDWNERLRKSKFDQRPRYGRVRTGHLGLQDHGDPVWFRNIKLGPLAKERQP
jgi:hypothetical protein